MLVAAHVFVLGSYLPPRVQVIIVIEAIIPAPDDHPPAGPYRRVKRIAPAGALVVVVADPRVRAGIVSAAGVE